MKHASRMRTACLLLASCSFLTPLWSHARSQDQSSKETHEQRSVRAALAAAQETMEQGEHDRAATLLENLLFQHPGHRDALLNLAYCYSRMDRAADAIDLYRQTLELEPKLLPARLNLALLLAEAEHFPAAAAEFKQALELEPDNYRARLSYAYTLEQAGEKDEALQQYLRAAEQDERAAEPRRAALALLEEKKDGPGAEQVLKELLALTPADFELVRLRAAHLLEEHRAEEALALYEAYLQAAGSDTSTARQVAEAHWQAGLLCRRAGKVEKALDHFAAAGQAEAYQLRSATALGETLAALKRYSEAIPHYRRAVELQPESADLHAGLGHSLLQNREYQEAARELIGALELDPKRVESYNHLASAFSLSDRPDGAIEVLAQRATLAAETPGTLFLRAISHDKLGQCAEAAEYYQKFLDTKPDGQSDQFFQAAGRLRLLKKTCREKLRRVK